MSGSQRGLAKRRQPAIVPVEQIDFSGRIERDVSPAAIVLRSRAALVDPHLGHRHIYGVKTAGGCIGQRNAQGTRRT